MFIQKRGNGKRGGEINLGNLCKIKWQWSMLLSAGDRWADWYRLMLPCSVKRWETKPPDIRRYSKKWCITNDIGALIINSVESAVLQIKFGHHDGSLNLYIFKLTLKRFSKMLSVSVNYSESRRKKICSNSKGALTCLPSQWPHPQEGVGSAHFLYDTVFPSPSKRVQSIKSSLAGFWKLTTVNNEENIQFSTALLREFIPP